MAANAHWADSVHRVGLACRQCGDVQMHELRYAGRLLASSRCLNCGAVVMHEEPDLCKAYLKDLEMRVRTKPRRMIKRAARHPATFVAHLPYAVLVKPVKMLEEAKPLFASLRGAHGR